MSGKANEAPIRVGGRLRHIKVDTNALCEVERLTGVDMVQGEQTASLSVLRALCYGALVSGARATGGKRDFTPEDVGDWMQDDSVLLEAVVALMKPAMPEEKPASRDPLVREFEKLERDSARGVPDPQTVQGETAPRLTA